MRGLIGAEYVDSSNYSAPIWHEEKLSQKPTTHPYSSTMWCHRSIKQWLLNQRQQLSAMYLRSDVGGQTAPVALQGACTYTNFMQENNFISLPENSPYGKWCQNWFSIQQQPSRTFMLQKSRSRKRIRRLRSAIHGHFAIQTRTTNPPHPRVRDAMEWLTDY
jgi:hypothetical protein